MTRLVLRTYSGGKVRIIHTGVINNIRMKRVVRAGRVVAEVAVLCVDRKSVNPRNGSSKMLQREVNSFKVSTISSRLLCCRILPESALLCPFSPVVAVDESREYLREYIPSITPTTTTNGPAHRMTTSPYRVVAQKLANIKKLSQGSPVVHDNNPASLFSGCMKGWLYAKARVICGGVATSRGDFWCTRIVDRCFNVAVVEFRADGEKAATVGEFGSPLAPGEAF